METQPPTPDQPDPLLEAEADLIAARERWKADPSPEHTAAYAAALDHALDVLEQRGRQQTPDQR